MDEDTLAVCILLFAAIFIVGFGFSLAFSITACVAWGRTKQWKKEKAHRNNPDAEEILLAASENENDSDLDPEDSDDEAELKVREEARQDWTLTTKQKFRKELKKAWKGTGIVEARRIQEREERKKVAKAVAKELAKMERKRERKANKAGSSSAEADGLPTYHNAMANDQKQ